MSGTTDGVVIIQSGSMLDKSYLDPMWKLNRIDVMCLRRVYVRRKCQITKDKTVRYFGDSRCVFLVGGALCHNALGILGREVVWCGLFIVFGLFTMDGTHPID